jgi:hypothetical protein
MKAATLSSNPPYYQYVSSVFSEYSVADSSFSLDIPGLAEKRPSVLVGEFII